MIKIKSKTHYSISMDKKLFELIANKIKNKSKYIEYLIYKDLMKNINDENLINLIL